MGMLTLALRNLLRNRRRSIATLLAITIGSMAILLFGGYKSDIKYNLQTDYVRRGGHLQIQHRDFYLFGSGNQAAYGIADYQGIMDEIRSDAVLSRMVLVVTPTLQFGGIAGNYAAGVSRTIIGNGLVAADHVLMRKWNGYDIGLSLPPIRLDPERPNSAVVGLGLARVLQLCDALKIVDCPQPIRVERGGAIDIPKDLGALVAELSKPSGTAPPARQASSAAPTIDVLASNARGTPNVASLEIVDAESQGFKELDEIYLLLHLKQAQRLVFGAETPKVTSIMIQLQDIDQISAAQNRINERLTAWSGGQPLAVRTFTDLNPFYVQSIQLFDTIFGFMFVLVGGVVMFTVSNTMNAAVVERTVEIGTLRAIGLRRDGVQRLFITEGALLGTFGALIGAVSAVAAAAVINRMGLHWFPPGGAAAVPLMLQVWGETSMIAATTIGLMVITTCSAWWPAFRAARLNVVDALRHA